MRKILLKSFLMVLLLSLTFGLHAQYKVTSSDFDTGIPSTWSQDPISAAVPWSSGSTGVGTIVPFIGSQYAKLYTNNPQVPVKLITPIVKISGVLEEPVVSFRVAQPSTGFGSFDTLRVYARNSVTGPWVQLHQEDAAVPA